MLEFLSFTLGPVQTNAYLLADPDTGEAAVIDPAWDGQLILRAANQRGWRIGQLWITHAHFDHIGGVAGIANSLSPSPSIALHAADRLLWQMGGGGALFGFRIDTGPKPSLELIHGETLQLGNLTFEVRHTPGHTPGHCVFYCAGAGVLFSGDLIFQGSVGRTDLPGGDWDVLVESIRTQVYPLPEETRICSGHGEETSVGMERRYNPFVGD